MKKQGALKNLLVASLVVGSVQASADEMTSTDLLNLLVNEGVVSEEKALLLVEKIRQRSEKEQALEEAESGTEASEADTVKVPYIPPYMMEELRDEIRQQLRADVVSDVMIQAKNERWGMPQALPAWVNKMSISGDVRVRWQSDFFPNDNVPWELSRLDYNDINDAGGKTSAGRDGGVNTTYDRHRMRVRARLMTQAKINNKVDAGIRMVTGSQGNPVSSNQTLGNYGEKYDWNVDLAYLRYRTLSKSLTISGGRFKNPFLHTDLVWDSDMTFEGLATKWAFNRGDSMYDDFQQWDPYITVGAFPLQEINNYLFKNDETQEPASANNDKWLYAMQFGMDYTDWSQNKLSFAIAYYHFDGVRGDVNPVGNDFNDETAAPFYQFGNTVFDIQQSEDTSASDELFALASEFHVLNATIKYDYAGFSPYHVYITADFIKNLGYDEEDVVARVNNSDITELPDHDEGHQVGLSVGWPELKNRGSWLLSFKYRHLEADAMVDAFVDSDFFLGGTNAKGYITRFDYGLMDDVTVTLRYLSADDINANLIQGAGVDTVQLDVAAKF